MGTPILVFGPTGAGKTFSLRSFAPNEIGYVNVENKLLSFRGQFESELVSDDYETIKKALSKTSKKTIVIDDSGYLMVHHFMNHHGKHLIGNAVFALFNKIGDDFFKLIQFIKNELPKDKLVYLMMHDETGLDGICRAKIVGKVLDTLVCVEGMFTIALHAIRSTSGYVFRTNSNGSDVAKTPYEMFSENEIQNDLKSVDRTIREYYKLNGEENNGEKI